MVLKDLEMQRQRWQDAVMLLVGVFLASSPWTFEPVTHEVPSASAILWARLGFGALIAFSGIFGLATFRAGGERAGIVLAIGLLGSPWYLNFSDNVLVTQITTGSASIVLVAATLALFTSRKQLKTAPIRAR